jgi:hypothetical protein
VLRDGEPPIQCRSPRAPPALFAEIVGEFRRRFLVNAAADLVRTNVDRPTEDRSSDAEPMRNIDCPMPDQVVRKVPGGDPAKPADPVEESIPVVEHRFDMSLPNLSPPSRPERLVKCQVAAPSEDGDRSEATLQCRQHQASREPGSERLVDSSAEEQS